MTGAVASFLRPLHVQPSLTQPSCHHLQERIPLPQRLPSPPAFSSNVLQVRAEGNGDSPAAPPAQDPVVRRKVLRRTSPPLQAAEELASPLKTVAVEEEGVSREGVARVDRARPDYDTNWGRIAALAAGDIASLLLFSAVGRQSHGLPLDWEVVRTADPFIAGWLLGAYFVGGFGSEAQGERGLAAASLSAVKSWAVGVPVALAIRTYTTGHPPAQPFIIVSLASILVLVTGWRTAFTAAFPNQRQTVAGDKKGSLFELFQLLGSLVRRW